MNNENEYNTEINSDNSFNNQGIEPLNNQYDSMPNTTSELTKFGKGLATGAKNGMNAKNNPALGFKKPKQNSDLGKKDNDKKGNNDKNNPATGQKTEDKNKKNNGQNKPNQKTPNLNNKKPGNNKGLDKAAKAIPHPAARAAALSGSKLGIGKKKKDDNNSSATEAPNLTQTAKSFNILGMKLTPVQIRIAISASIIIILVFAFLIFLAILNGTTAAVTAAMCGETDYDIGNADITAFMCSMQDPVDGNYTLTSLYGWRNYNTSRMHHGVDLGGSVGTPIVAVHEGEVIQTLTGQPNCDSCGYGNYVTVKHSDNSYTRYAHLSTVAVSRGDKVTKGQKIGEMGNTGSSSGPHLHFEIRTGLGYTDTVSPNAFFGYSDKGYEDCLDPNKGHDSRCGIDKSGNARKIGDEAFKQICGRTPNYSSDSGDCCGQTPAGTSDDFMTFLSKFEGKGKSCTTKSGKIGYLAENLGDGAITAGSGVTNAPVKRSDSQEYIKSSGYKSDFTLKDGKYVMVVGGCYPQSVIDGIKKISIENGYAASVTKSAEQNGVTLTQYEKDALTSFNYNLGSGHIDKLIKAYKNDGYEGLWDSMKGYVHSQGKTLPGLQKRRKAEFALFVTGDYTDQGLFYSRNITDYDNYDSENVMARKATGTASVCTTISGNREAVVERAQQEYEIWHSKKEYCNNIKKYLASCGYAGGKGGNDEYCAGFVTYILKEAGVAEQIGLPGYTCVVSNFKNTKNGTVKKAGGSYIPQPGDIMIVNGWGHIVLVEKVEGKRVYYIGGNEGGNGYCNQGKVNKGSFSLSSGSIAAYVTY